MEAEAGFEAYSYRTSSRFGSRVRLSISNGLVTVTGPRVGILPYRLWIGVQAVFLILSVLAVLAALLYRDWQYLGLGLLFLACHACAGGFGAGCLWELANLIAFGADGCPNSATFPIGAIKSVKIGPGWARKGLWLLIFPYVFFINKMSEGLCVSFEAPDGDRNPDGVYALHMRSKEEARRLAERLVTAPEGKEAAIAARA